MKKPMEDLFSIGFFFFKIIYVEIMNLIEFAAAIGNAHALSQAASPRPSLRALATNCKVPSLS